MNRTPQVNRNASAVAWVVVLAVAFLAIGYVAGGYLIKNLGGGHKPTTEVKSGQITGQVITEEGAEANANADPNANADTGTNTGTGSPEATVTPDAQQGNSQYIVQLGAFGSRENAEKLKNELIGKGYQNVTVTEGPYYKVQLSNIASKEEATQLKDQIKDAGYVDVFVSVH